MKTAKPLSKYAPIIEELCKTIPEDLTRIYFKKHNTTVIDEATQKSLLIDYIINAPDHGPLTREINKRLINKINL